MPLEEFPLLEGQQNSLQDGLAESLRRAIQDRADRADYWTDRFSFHVASAFSSTLPYQPRAGRWHDGANEADVTAEPAGSEGSERGEEEHA
jgi:hypothetical protein